MREREPNPILQELFLRFDKAGGVVDFVLFDTDESGLSAHRQAAVSGMEVIAARRRAAYGRDWMVMTPEKAVGHSISLTTFFGPPATSVSAWGFESACKTPPYSVSRDMTVGSGDPPMGHIGIYDALVDALGLRAPGVEIVAWSTDWSNYFDAGEEWWGAHLWTLRLADGVFLWIGVSDTD